MGNFLICFFFLFFISIQNIESILILRTYNIDISNHLAGNKKLMIICRSGDQASPLKFLPFNVIWRIKFTIYPKTLIWCHVWKGPNYVHHVKFNAFIAKESFIHDVCGGRKPNACFWQPRESGIWARNNSAGTLKFTYKWDINTNISPSY
ncbi:putative plant self-incompatibility S1 [Arabidopsis thaliana]